MKICSFFKAEEWPGLRTQLVAGDEEAWRKAVHVFECRMKERFFSGIELLLGSKTSSQSIVPGFAVMALCCILVETLQAFYEGHIMQPPEEPEGPCPYPEGDCLKMPRAVETKEKCGFPEDPCVRTPPTARSFVHFLRDSSHFGDFNGKARRSFSIQIRNGLLHDAETRGRWLIRENDPRDKILERRGEEYVLNRTRFYNALKAEFRDYLARLGDSTKDTLRNNFLKKMDNICHFEPTVE